MSKDLFSNSAIGAPDNRPQVLKIVATIIAVAVGFLAAQFMGAVLVVSAMSATGMTSDQIQNTFSDNSWVQFAVILIIEILTAGLVYWYLKITNRRFLAYLRLDNKLTKKLLGSVVATYLLYFPVFIAVATLASRFIPTLDTEQMQQIGFENTSGIDYLAVFMSLAVLPPLVEEIVFRGVLYQKLKQYSSVLPAVLITSIVFGLAHLEFFGDGPLNWIAALDTFVFSLFLTGLYVKTGSLWAPIFLHALKNSIAFTFLFLL